MRLPRIIIWLVVLAVLAAGAVFIGYPLAEEWRAGHLLTQAEEAYAEEEYQIAFEKSLSAHYLSPEDSEILLHLARSALKYRHLNAADWWRKAIQTADADPADVVELVNFLVAVGDEDEARRFLQYLEAEHAENPDVQLVQLRLARRARNVAESYALAQELMNAPGEHPPERRQQVVQVFLTMDPQLWPEGARDYIFSTAQGQDTAAVRVLRSIVSGQMIEVAGGEESFAEYAQLLANHPEAALTDRLLAANMLEQIGREAQSEQLLEEVSANLGDDPEDLAAYAGWLLSRNRPQEVLDLVTRDQALSAEGLFWQFVRAKIAAGQAEDAYEMTLLPVDQVPATADDIRILRAEALEATGQPAEADDTLNVAAEVVRLDRFERLETYLINRGEWRPLLTLYQRLADNSRTEQVGKQKLAAAYYHLGHDSELSSLLGRFDEMDPDETSPAWEAFYTYMKLLYEGPDIPERARVEELIAEYPSVSDFRLVLGLIYYLEGDAESAEALVSNVQMDGEGVSRHLRMAGLVLGVTDTTPDELVGSLGPSEELLKAERRLLNTVRQQQQSAPEAG